MPSPYDAPVTAAPPESAHVPVVVGATLHSRFVGRSIDTGIVWGLALLGFYLTPFLIGVELLPRRALLGASLGGGLILALLWSAFQWVSLANTGQTVGRRVARVRVVDLNAEAPGFFRGILLREWLFWAPAFVVLGVGLSLGVGLEPGVEAGTIPSGIRALDPGPSVLPAMFRAHPVVLVVVAAGLRAADFAFAAFPGARCLHDRLAKTRVIHWDARAQRVYERSRVHGSAT